MGDVVTLLGDGRWICHYFRGRVLLRHGDAVKIGKGRTRERCGEECSQGGELEGRLRCGPRQQKGLGDLMRHRREYLAAEEEARIQFLHSIVSSTHSKYLPYARWRAGPAKSQEDVSFKNPSIQLPPRPPSQLLPRSSPLGLSTFLMPPSPWPPTALPPYP